MAFKLSGNALVLINAVTLRRARLVLSMGDRFRTGKAPQHRTSHPHQLGPGYPSVGRRDEYQRKLGSKWEHRMIHYIARIHGLAASAGV